MYVRVGTRFKPRLCFWMKLYSLSHTVNNTCSHSITDSSKVWTSYLRFQWGKWYPGGLISLHFRVSTNTNIQECCNRIIRHHSGMPIVFVIRELLMHVDNSRTIKRISSQSLHFLLFVIVFASNNYLFEIITIRYYSAIEKETLLCMHLAAFIKH